MPLSTETVNIDVTLPDGSEIPEGRGFVEFELTASDRDTVDNHTIPKGPIRVALDATGTATVSLWPNDRGTGGTFYSVKVIKADPDGATTRDVTWHFGFMQIEDAGGPYDLATEVFAGVTPGQAGVVTLKGRIRTGDGTAAQPAYSFADDPDTGAYRIGANAYGISAGGSRKARFHPGGMEITGELSGTAVQQSKTDTTEGRALLNGAHGLGSFTSSVLSQSDANAELPCGFYGGSGSGASNFPSAGQFRPFVVMNRRSNDTDYYVVRMFFQSGAVPVTRESTDSGATWTADNTLWGTANTTVDGSGFILEASPIIRVYADSISEPNKPLSATLTHSETGVYVLSEVPPLATEGWNVRTPDDLNGNKVVAIDPPEYDAEAGTLTLRTYDLLWHEGRLVPGDPMDVPGDYFVMLRFHEEPADDEVAE